MSTRRKITLPHAGTSIAIPAPPVAHREEIPAAKVRCPKCASRLEVMETPSGARTVSVVFLAPAVENTAQGLESFMAADAGPELICPACRKRFDPAEPSSAIRPLTRTQTAR
jgi:DNA-directed RNA polymerase subunit RPC12/RpoP